MSDRNLRIEMKRPPRKIKDLESMAREMVGDGKAPNLFFVSVNGTIVTVTRDFDRAYSEWSSYPMHCQAALEDRQTGTIANVQPVEGGGTKLERIDDSRMFGFRS